MNKRLSEGFLILGDSFNLSPMKQNIKILSWFNFCTDFVFFAPVAIIYFAQVTGSYGLGMSIFSIAYVTAAIFEVPTGMVSDLVGRKKTLILGSVCAVICMVLYALAQGYWILFLGALFQGLSRSFYSGNNDALLHDSLKSINEHDQYHTYLGKTSSMFQIALAIASVTGSIMAAKSFTLVMWASVVPQLCGLILAFLITEPKIYDRENSNIYAHLKKAIMRFRQNFRLQLITYTSIVKFSLGESAFFIRSVFVNTLWPLWAVGISNMISNIGGAISYYFSGKIINKFGYSKMLNLEIIFNRIVNLIALLFPTVASPVLIASSSLTYGVGSVATNSLLQKEFTEKQRATMGSLASFAGSIGFGIAAVLLGFLADKIGARWTLIIANILLFTPLFFYRKVFTHTLKHQSG